MSDKLPAIQWYVGDWRKDSGVQSLDYHHRGVWFEMLNLMHDMPRGGAWSLDGDNPIPDSAGARILNLSIEEYQNCIKLLIDRKVAKSSPSDLQANESLPDNIVFSRRMLRFWDIRQKRADAGSKGGLQKASNARAKASSSVSSSSSTSTSEQKYPKGFEEWWALYPNKVGKKAALRAWKKAMKDGDWPGHEAIIEALRKHKTSAQWLKQGGEFVPHPTTWLNQGRWDDELDGKPKVGTGKFDHLG